MPYILSICITFHQHKINITIIYIYSNYMNDWHGQLHYIIYIYNYIYIGIIIIFNRQLYIIYIIVLVSYI